ncbi:MAG TPA: hypothetical protein VKD08_15695 [Ignavibacteriaceae bacterium]|nr:hypothetical protein [Ignavibacteriaceae bacterium]
MKLFKTLLSVLFLLLFVSESYSLPRYALRMGGTCADCHVNPTGGLMRNSGGWMFGKNVLPMERPSKEFPMSDKLNENIQFGMDIRGNGLLYMTDSTKRIDFQKMTGSVYTNVDLSEKISAFARYDFIWQIWEAYAIAHILPNDGYLKGGSFTPNYGIRLDDHTAYTRGGDLGLITPGASKRGLIFDPRYVESGVEVGQYISDFALITASVGNSHSPNIFVTDPSYTANLLLYPTVSDVAALMFGGSVAIFKQQTFAGSTVRFPEVQMYGGYAGIGIGDFTLMGEYDIANNYVKQDSASTALMIEAAYSLVKGLDAVVRYDRFDPLTSRENDDISRLIVGFEFHPYSFVEIRPQYRFQMEHPSIMNDTFLVQFHLWY